MLDDGALVRQPTFAAASLEDPVELLDGVGLWRDADRLTLEQRRGERSLLKLDGGAGKRAPIKEMPASRRRTATAQCLYDGWRDEGSKAGKVSRFTPESDDLLGVFGLVIDEAGGAIWAATANGLIDAYNAYLRKKAEDNPSRITLVDVNSLLKDLTDGKIAGLSSRFILLDPTQTAQRLPYPALAAEIRRLLADGAVQVPPRLVQALPGGGSLFVMPAFDASVAITKLITFTPRNVGTKTPTIQGDVVVFDVETGRRRLVLDGPTVTARRTAAVSLLAAQWLAPNTSGPLLVVGAGAQGRAHLEAFAQWGMREVLIH